MKQQITEVRILLLLVCLFLFIYLFYSVSQSKLQWAEEDVLSWCLEAIL